MDIHIGYQTSIHKARRAGSDGSMSASVSIPGGVLNFNLKIFNLGARSGGDVHFLIARFIRRMGTLSLAVPWCFSRRAGYEPAPGFTFSLLSPSCTTQLHQTVILSHPNLNFLQYTIQILVPHVMWSAQEVRDSKIDHT